MKATDRLAQEKLESLSKVILEIYRPLPLAELPAHLLVILGEALSPDRLALAPLETGGGGPSAVLDVASADCLPVMPVFSASVQGSPVIRIILDGASILPATSVTDLHHESRDFSDEEIFVLNILRPHVQRAFEIAHALEVVGSSAHFKITNAGPEQMFMKPDQLDGLGLSLRETEVAFWIFHGKTSWEIGRILHVSARTIEKHIEHIFLKLRVNNREGLAAKAREFCTFKQAHS